MSVPEIRIHRANDAAVRSSGKYVLYWMIAQRRTDANFALQRAVEYSQKLSKPLLILEALRCDYRWASERLHRFVIDGMCDNAAACEKAGVTYFPYLEPARNAGNGLLEALAEHAAVVVTDEFPCFFLPKMVQVTGEKLDVLMEMVDSNGLVPLRAPGRDFFKAYDFRRWLQKNLIPHLDEFPVSHPFEDYQQGAATLPRGLHKQWPSIDPQTLQKSPDGLQEFPLDHTVKPSFIRGGSAAAHEQLKWFMKKSLALYGEERSHPDSDAASGLSPYLHFGHISVQQVFNALMKQESWKPKHIQPKVTGSNEGWWGTSPTLESYLDELITWRELGYNFSFQRDDYYRYSSLPDWARNTLEKHARDPREFTYTVEQFAASQTHDALWNAAQTQLREEGRMHNYLRMLWGKKILEWTDHPREALKIMLELNNRYAIDGRDPNSYSGIFWVLGRYDRPWAPEREIFGMIRYMSSENTQKKLRLKKYLAKYGAQRARSLNFEA